MRFTSKPKESTIDGFESLPPSPSSRMGREALARNEINRGGHLLSNMNSVLLPTPNSIFDRGARRVDNNRAWTIMQTLNFMIGSGILNTAQIFMDSGVVAATVMYIIAAFAIWYGQVILVRASEVASLAGGGESRSGVYGEEEGAALEELDYAVVAKRTLGERSARAVDTFIILPLVGGCLSYLILIGDLLTSVLSEWTETDNSSAFAQWWYSFYFVTPLAVMFFVLPPCLIRHFSNLRWLSVFSLMATCGTILLVNARGFSYADDKREGADHDPDLDAPVLLWSSTGMLSKMGSVLFSISCAPAVLHSYSSMAQRTIREWEIVMASALVMGTAFCFMTGLVGYLSFRDATEGDILDNFDGTFASIFKTMVVIHLLLYVPNEVVIIRHSLFTLAERDVMEASFPIVAGATIGVLGFLVGIVVGLMLTGTGEGDLFGYILDLTGGVCGSVITFVLPALMYLEATRGIVKDKGVAWHRKACYTLAGLGLLVMIIVPVAVFLTAIGYF